MGATDTSQFKDVPSRPIFYGLTADEEEINSTSERYCLILHPWGHSRLDLVRIPDCEVEMPAETTRRSNADGRYCCMRCGERHPNIEAMKGVCLFHPGKRHCPLVS